ncbi:MAG: hypothetical protein ABIX01_18235 [Chitinophagaceae bacterium]
MNKIITAIVAIAVFTTITISHVIAQETALNNTHLPESKNVVSPAPTTKNPSSSSATATLQVSIRALRDFEKSYRELSEPVWSLSDEGGFIASFKDKRITTNVFYNKKGRWQYAIKRYDEQQLDRGIIDLVMPSYRGYKINGVAELSVYNSTIYLLYLQDAGNFKTVRIVDGEADVIEWIKDGRIMPL